MSPFDPPVGSPQSVEPPHQLRRRRRNRRASVALASVGLIGAGIVGVGQLVSADRSDVRAATGESAPPVTTAPTAAAPAEPDETPATTVADDPVTDDADDRRIDIDLGEFDAGVIGSLAECLGLPSFQTGADGPLDPGEMPEDLGAFLDELFSGGTHGPFADGELDAWLDEWLSGVIGDSGPVANSDTTLDLDVWLDEFSTVLEDGAPDGQVTVSGPDGVTVIDLGDDGSVTISRDGGTLSIETEGDATVIDFDELLGDLGDWLGDDVPVAGEGDAVTSAELERWLDELLADVPTDLPEFGSVDGAGVQACVDDVLGR